MQLELKKKISRSSRTRGVWQGNSEMLDLKAVAEVPESIAQRGQSVWRPYREGQERRCPGVGFLAVSTQL